jgi:hypothetical protein
MQDNIIFELFVFTSAYFHVDFEKERGIWENWNGSEERIIDFFSWGRLWIRKLTHPQEASLPDPSLQSKEGSSP